MTLFCRLNATAIVALLLTGCGPQIVFVQQPAATTEASAAKATAANWTSQDLKSAADVCNGKDHTIGALFALRKSGVSQDQAAEQAGTWLADGFKQGGIDSDSESAQIMISITSRMINAIYAEPHDTVEESVAAWEDSCFRLMADSG